MAAVSIRGQIKHGDVPNRRKIGWVLESIRKYAVDFSVNFSKKGEKGEATSMRCTKSARRHSQMQVGLPQLHKTVEEELKDGAFLKVCNDREKQKLDTISRSENEMIKMEKAQEEMNVTKLKNGMSAEQLDPISLNKFPPEQVKQNNFLNPNRKRIMIRSRL